MKKITYPLVVITILMTVVGVYFMHTKLLSVENDNVDDKTTISDSVDEDLLKNTENSLSNQNTDINQEELTPQTVSEPYYTALKNGQKIIIVNKKHPLPQNFNPGVNKEAQKHVNELIVDAQKSKDKYASKITFSTSNFRSFNYQKSLYDGYVSRNGQKNADRFSARPGYSEHQTGLAFDLMANGNLYRIDDSSYNYASDWLYLNSYKYGFIVRYRDDTESITGYKGEPWHLRYLGKNLANSVYLSGKTLEEYFGVSGGDY